MIVLTVDRWRESEGVQAEIVAAEQLGKTVVFIDPPEVAGWPTAADVAAGRRG